MKFIDLLNEEYLTPDQEKELKKCKIVFKALKKGIIHDWQGGFTVKYVIGDKVFYRWEYYMRQEELTIITNNLPGEGVKIYTDNEELYNKLMNPIPSFSKNFKYDYEDAIKRKIRQRFMGSFGVKIFIGNLEYILVKKEE